MTTSRKKPRGTSTPQVDDPFAGRLEKIKDSSVRATLIAKAVRDAAEISEANTVLFAQAVFEEFSKKEEDRDDQRLVKYMTLALKSRAVDLTYQRFRFEAAARARECVAELREINKSEGNEREKTMKAISILFGDRPENTLL